MTDPTSNAPKGERPESLCAFIVDDDAEVRESLALLLQSKRISVQVFSSAEEFFSQFDRASRGCLILDYKLPGASGLEVARRLFDDQFNLPTIMITAYANRQLAEKARTLGVAHLIKKPFNPDDLLDCVVQLFQGCCTDSDLAIR